MKKKTILIISGVVLVLICAALVYFLLNNNKKVTLTFDTDGGISVNNIVIKKGSSTKLPTTTKEGYLFNGWTIDGSVANEDTKFDKDVTLKATWIQEDAKTFKIIFNTNGGKTIEPLTLECDKPIENLPVPTKKDNTFISWVDKNSKPILNGALLTCEDIELTAKWEKKTTTTTTTTTKKVEYTCPNGYKLDGTKCTSTIDPKSKCEGTRVFDYNGKCVTINNTVRKDTQRACPQETVTYMSFAGKVDGKVVNWGVIGCAYYKTNDTSKDNCESHGFKWVTPENACYVKWISNNTINSCNHLSNYAYITNPNTYEGVNGLNGGCFPISNKTTYCDDGYTLTEGKCIKTINATTK